MSSVIRSVRARDTKPPMVTLTVASGEETVKYTITEGTYRGIGCPLSGVEIEDGALEVIAAEDEERRAVAKALSALSYSDKNERELYAKLVTSGFSREAAEAAVKECVMLGYVNERRQIEHLVRKYYRALEGPSRIAMRLAARGYRKDEARAVITELRESGELDFAASRAALIEKKLPEGASSEEVKKLLFKHGYGHD